ncbi:SdpI family protein [Flavobacterium sp. WC2430]|uniref:SdpI family protein n=1 Tax=Flavobacterium sp. WC2430 TaxID=3234137 RepID=UPI003466E56C
MDYPISISILLLVISIIAYLFQPKKINSIYGYRTAKSKKNIENWKIANRFSAIGLIIISIINIIIFYLSSFFIHNIDDYIFTIILAFEFVILIYLTEKKLTQNENK